MDFQVTAVVLADPLRARALSIVSFSAGPNCRDLDYYSSEMSKYHPEKTGAVLVYLPVEPRNR